MSFGDKHLDESYDRWVTQTPEDYYGGEFECCICGELCYGYGNNPEPLKSEGRCCDDCNIKVIEERLRRFRKNV